MGLSWCLVTGFDTFVTYFYAIYFAVLLVHVSMSIWWAVALVCVFLCAGSDVPN